MLKFNYANMLIITLTLISSKLYCVHICPIRNIAINKKSPLVKTRRPYMFDQKLLQGFTCNCILNKIVRDNLLFK